MTLIASVVLDAITGVHKKHQSHENRLPSAGAFMSLLAQNAKTPIASELAAMKEKENQATKITVLTKFAPTNVTADTCSPSGEKATSALQTISWQNTGFAIVDAPEIHYGNFAKQKEYFEHNYRQGLIKTLKDVDTTAVTFLEAQKSAMSGITSKYFDIASNKATLTNPDTKQLFSAVPGLMDKMDITGPFVSVGDTELKTQLNWIAQNGAGNGVNNAASINNGLPFSDDFRHFFSNRIDPGSDKHIAYMFPEGSAAVANWTRPGVRAGMEAAGGKHVWKVISDPITGLDWELHVVDDCTDLSATYSWLPATKATTYVFILKYAYIPIYSSDSNTPFIKVAIPEV